MCLSTLCAGCCRSTAAHCVGTYPDFPLDAHDWLCSHDFIREVLSLTNTILDDATPGGAAGDHKQQQQQVLVVGDSTNAAINGLFSGAWKSVLQKLVAGQSDAPDPEREAGVDELSR